MKVETLAVIGTLGGVIVGALSSFCITWLTKKFEDRRHRREVVIHAALENWKTNAEFGKHIASKSGKGVTLYPLDDFIIHQAKLADVLLKKKTTSKELRKALEEDTELRKILVEHRKKQKAEEKGSD